MVVVRPRVADRRRDDAVRAVHQISACLERARAELNRRSIELEDMMLEWRQFDETMAEFERWVSVVEEDCQTHATRAADANTVADVTHLIADNHVSLPYFLMMKFIRHEQ